MAIALVLVGLLATAGPPAAAQSPDPDPAEAAQLLAERHAPVFRLRAQEAPCDARGEQYEPTAVETVLGNPEVALRQVSPGDPVAVWGPEPADLHGRGEGWYLEYPGSALDPGCVYERDFLRYSADIPPTVYARVATEASRPGLLGLQYWTFWYYNDWNNKHETDWEFTQLLFEADSVEAALAADPAAIGYAQHEGGERADWTDTKVEKLGARPVVYPSAGSHASYFSSEIWLGRSGAEGFGCDNTTGPSRDLDPEVVLLPDAPSGPDDPFAWLAFEGRWGERQSGPFNGPTGPMAKDRWHEPVTWHDGLRDASVAIPTGDSFGNEVLLTFCDVVERGSGVFIRFLDSPTQILLAAAAVVGLVLFAVRRTRWSPADPSPIRTRRRAGQIIHASFRAYRRRPVTLLLIGLVYLPITLVVAVAIGLLSRIGTVDAVYDLVEGGMFGPLLALTLGSLGNILAFLFVQAAVADLLDHDDRGTSAGGREAYRLMRARIGDLLAAGVRAAVYVVLLAVTVIGLPVALWLVVRYQFLAQAIVLDGASGRDALHRSGARVDGRWLHTALMVLVINGTVLAVSFLVALLLLILFAGLPLWAFNLVSALVLVGLVPLGAVAFTLLYGDRVAAEDGADAELVEA